MGSASTDPGPGGRHYDGRLAGALPGGICLAGRPRQRIQLPSSVHDDRPHLPLRRRSVPLN